MSRTAGGGWGLGWYRTVQLLDDEQVLYEADAGLNAGWRCLVSTWGKLYVTNLRLIWARGRFMPPIPREPILSIAVDDILDVEVHRGRLGVQTGQYKYWFNFGWFFADEAKEGRAVIAKVIRSK